MQLDFLLVHYPLKEINDLKKNQTKTNFQMVLTFIFRTGHINIFYFWMMIKSERLFNTCSASVHFTPFLHLLINRLSP